MKPYSIETSEKIVKVYEQRDTSIGKVAARFDVSKAFYGGDNRKLFYAGFFGCPISHRHLQVSNYCPIALAIQQSMVFTIFPGFSPYCNRRGTLTISKGVFCPALFIQSAQADFV
jgi:hypothetical protein